MNSIKKLFRHSSIPQTENKNNNNNKSGDNNLKNQQMKGCLKLSNSGPESMQTKWDDLKNIDDDGNEEDLEDGDDMSESKEFAHKDKRRASIVISKKLWNCRRNSSVSNASSISESSETLSFSENDDKDTKKKLSIREQFENPETRNKNSRGFDDFCVSKINEASLGRREIEIAQQEMKGFLSVIASMDLPLKGSVILGCTHITAQTAVLIEGLVAWGASVRWCACNIYSTQNEVAAALAESGISIYAWKGQSEDDFWWSIDKCCDVKEGSHIDLILDDGGDLTQRLSKVNPTALNNCKGIVEESMTGIHRLYLMLKNKTLDCPAINMSESVTKSKFDSYYLCKETIIDALKRSTDTAISGKVILICGFGSVGKGCSQALRGMGAQILISEVDPICSIQACIEGYRVVLMESALPTADIVVTCTGTLNLLSASDFEKLKDGCIVCNMGHPTSEIDVESLNVKGVVWERIRNDVDYIILPSNKRIILIAQGRVANLNCSTVPSIVISITSTAQVLALVELFTARDGRYKNEIYLIPKKCDELIAKSHLPIFGAQLNELTDKQAKYLGISKHGPFKTNYYSHFHTIVDHIHKASLGITFHHLRY